MSFVPAHSKAFSPCVGLPKGCCCCCWSSRQCFFCSGSKHSVRFSSFIQSVLWFGVVCHDRGTSIIIAIKSAQSKSRENVGIVIGGGGKLESTHPNSTFCAPVPFGTRFFKIKKTCITGRSSTRCRPQSCFSEG